MTWFSEGKLTWFERVCLTVLKAGRVPKHVAFIMDGNRRFARQNCFETVRGHSMGFSKLAETLKWCRDLGITEVTVYAFSIENFRRPQQEVDDLMKLAHEKFQLLLNEREKLMKHGVCVRFIGDISLLPLEIQQQIAVISLLTRNNTAARLNVAFSYTAREEITQAVRQVSEGVCAGQLKSEDISASVLDSCMYTHGSRNPDLLVRTSGEVRLSDFLLWQTTHTCIYFSEVLWPEFTVWQLFAAVFSYQRSFFCIQNVRTGNSNLDEISSLDARDGDKKRRIADFVTAVERRRWKYLEKLAHSIDSTTTTTDTNSIDDIEENT